MVVSLPTELVECIIDNFDSFDDKSTLLNCVLVGRAWVYASQRIIFQTILLKAPNPYYDIHHNLRSSIDHFMEANTRLIASLDEKPVLVSYVLCLKLENFDRLEIEVVSSDDDMDDVCASMAKVVNRLTKVKKILMVSVDWDVLSSMLITALTDMLSTPSVTSLAVESFTIADSDFASLLNHSVHLKTLEAVNVTFRKKLNANINSTGRPLKLDTLVFGSWPDDDFSWFQQRSCPFVFENLQSLKTWVNSTGDYEMTAFLLQQAGHSLTKLELDLRLGMSLRLGLSRGKVDMKLGLDMLLKRDMGWLRTETTLENLLGYAPNLKCIRLVELPQRGSYTPVPWILSLFKPLLNSDSNRYPLECITFGLWVDYSVTMEWDSWSAFDVLLKDPKFNSLRTVDIVMKMDSHRSYVLDKGREAAKAAVENLTGNLPFLKRSGKLQIRVEK